MTEKVRVVKSFRFAHHIHGEPIAEGEYAVGDWDPANGSITEECATIAKQEGWAVPLGRTVSQSKESGRQSQGSGQTKPSASSRQAKAPAKKTSKKSGAKQKSS